MEVKLFNCILCRCACSILRIYILFNPFNYRSSSVPSTISWANACCAIVCNFECNGHAMRTPLQFWSALCHSRNLFSFAYILLLFSVSSLKLVAHRIWHQTIFYGELYAIKCNKLIFSKLRVPVWDLSTGRAITICNLFIYQRVQGVGRFVTSRIICIRWWYCLITKLLSFK